MIGRAINFKSSGGSPFIINNNASQPLLQAQSPFYYIQVTDVDGLSSSDISYESHPVPFGIGEVSGDVYRRGKSITLTGKIKGLNLKYLETGADFLEQMFAEKAIRKLTWTRWNDAVEIYLNCRINNDLSISRSFTEGKYEWGWTVGLRADDPRTRRISDGSVYPTFQQ